MFDKPWLHGSVAGIIASLCCLGPTLIFMLGLGSVLGLTGLCLTQFRPLFLTLGIIFLFSGIFLYVRKRHGSCSIKSVNKNRKFIVISVITMALIYATVIVGVVPLIHGELIGKTCSI